MKSNIIWDELKFFLTRLKALRNSEVMLLKDEGFCVSTCCDFESWVYCPFKIEDEALADDVIRFFRERNISFMWPMYDGGGEILERAGLLYAGDLTAMTLDPKSTNTPAMNHNITFERVSSCERANDFARSVWLGFNGEPDDIPKNYCTLMEGLSEDKENLRMYLAKYDDKYAGTFLVTNEPELMGVYYFSTLPEFRHKGIARTMMGEICKLSEGKRIVLQATPNGVKFYEAVGFEELFKMPVYSTEADIF